MGFVIYLRSLPSTISRSNLSAKVDQYVDVLREASVHLDVEVDVRERLQCLLSSLIAQNIHHRDVMDGEGPCTHGLRTCLVLCMAAVSVTLPERVSCVVLGSCVVD